MDSPQFILALIAAVAGATIWIVSAIHGVRDSVNLIGVELKHELKDHERRITDLETEVWQEN